MRYPILASVVAVATFFAIPPARAADETEHISRTVALDPGGTLRLKSFSGRVTITAMDRKDVSIDAVRRAPRERLDAIKLDIQTEGSHAVVIDANRREHSWYEFMRHNDVVETNFDIKVPRQTNLDVSVFSAPVTTAAIDGEQRIHTFGSRLQLDDAAGSIEAHTFSGPVEIHERDWQPGRRISVNTFSGDIELRVPASTQADVIFDSFSGHLSSAVPLTLNSSSRRAMRARLGAGGGGELKLKTFSGNGRIEVR